LASKTYAPADGGPAHKPEDDDKWARNPRPQNTIKDTPGDGSVYVAQLVCQKDGKIWGSWRYKKGQTEPVNVTDSDGKHPIKP